MDYEEKYKDAYKLVEQNPADIPEDFEKLVEHLLSLSDGEGHGSPAKVKYVSAKLLRLAKLQKPAWSEEDERKRRYIENELSCLIADEREIESPLSPRLKDLYSALYWLESLSPQSHWKPSDKQMEQLGWIAEQNKDNMIGKELMTLYNDLKKLKG